MEAGVHPLGRLIPELRPHLRDDATSATAAPETAPFELFQDTAALLRRIAAETPLLLVVEDLHCADQPSLLLLELLAHELPDSPIVAVGAADTFRHAAALARRIGAPAMLARAAIGLSDVGTGWTECGRSDETLIRILDEALGALDARDAPLRPRVMARLATELCWSAPPERIEGLSARAVARGHITKAGTARLRTLLVEAA